MENNLKDIKEVHESRNPDEVNLFLKEGWVLSYINHEPSRSRYVLIKFE